MRQKSQFRETIRDSINAESVVTAVDEVEQASFLLNRAFEDLQNTLGGIVTSLGGLGAQLLHAQEFKKATEVATRCQKLQALNPRVKALHGEFLAVLLNPNTERETPGSSGRPVSQEHAVARRGRSSLNVTLSDGTVIAEKLAKDTFIQTLRALGLERISRLGLTCRELPLVHLGYTQHHHEKLDCSMDKIDDYVVITHSSTSDKKRILTEIARMLGEYIFVEIQEDQ